MYKCRRSLYIVITSCPCLWMNSSSMSSLMTIFSMNSPITSPQSHRPEYLMTSSCSIPAYSIMVPWSHPPRRREEEGTLGNFFFLLFLRSLFLNILLLDRGLAFSSWPNASATNSSFAAGKSIQFRPSPSASATSSAENSRSSASVVRLPASLLRRSNSATFFTSILTSSAALASWARRSAACVCSSSSATLCASTLASCSALASCARRSASCL